ncbi:MAG: hypothetical protein JNL32_03645 [Candidatus Kapabacteria bacterium]|nr:hypothetical protein [Candidatus Kapabacteria bacterium]
MAKYGKETAGGRLHLIAVDLGGVQKLAELMGMNNAAGLYGYFNNNRNIGLKMAHRIREIGYNDEWVITGHGDMKLHEEESEPEISDTAEREDLLNYMAKRMMEYESRFEKLEQRLQRLESFPEHADDVILDTIPHQSISQTKRSTTLRAAATPFNNSPDELAAQSVKGTSKLSKGRNNVSTE